MLADIGFATIFGFVFFWLNARAERIDVSAEFSAKLPADFVAARCHHRQRWPKNWRRERKQYRVRNSLTEANSLRPFIGRTINFSALKAHKEWIGCSAELRGSPTPLYF
jgi:hypothetical protein